MAVSSARPHSTAALYALAVGAFGIGTTEFMPMGLLQQIAGDLHVGIPIVGLLISGYALGVFLGAPLITLATRTMPRKAVLLALMAVFTLGNLVSALAPDYSTLLAARVLTSLAHGTFFGVGSVVATSLVPKGREASAISTMFTGLAVATLLGVPGGAWLGLHFGWHSAFWAVTLVGVLAMTAVAVFVPASRDDTVPVALAAEMRAIGNRSVLLGLLITVLGYAGVFVVYTYIEPILVRVTGFADAAVSPILLVFGVGIFFGTVLGGRFADRSLAPALLGALALLAVVLGAFGLVLHSGMLMVLFIGLLGMAAFSTVAPLQLWILRKAAGAPSLASSLNIGAFNLANALGAWLGSRVISAGAGLEALPWVATLVTAMGLLVAMYVLRRDHADTAAVGLDAACART